MDLTSNSSSVLKIEVIDMNDNTPYFVVDGVDVFEVAENSQIGTLIGNVTAFDVDNGIFGQIRYSATSDIVRIDDKDGFLYLAGSLNREDRSSYIIVITATDGGGLSTTVSISLSILDENDNPPIFINQIIVGYTNEGVIGLRNALIIRVTDDDADNNGNITISTNRDYAKFNLTRISKVEWMLDTILPFELSSNMKCLGDTVLFDEYIIIAHDDGIPRLSAEKPITINVVDENNHAPFINKFDPIVIAERTSVGTVMAEFNVSDHDPCSPNNLYSLSVVGDYADFFRIEETRLLVASDQIDFETFGPLIEITVKASDRGIPRLHTHHFIEVVVTDINDEAPQIPHCTIAEWVEENITVGEVIGNCEVIDKDTDAKLDYFLSCECKKDVLKESCEKFSILNKNNSVIFVVSEQIDFEMVSEIICVLHVTDAAADQKFPDQTTVKSIFVNVIDNNDNIPLFELDTYRFDVPENMATGQVVGTVRATDLDIDDIIIYAMLNFSHITVDERSGEIKIETPFDYE